MSDIPATSDPSHLHSLMLNEGQLVFNFNGIQEIQDYYSQLSALNQLLPSFSTSLPTVQCSFPSRQLIALANLQLQQHQGNEPHSNDVSSNFFAPYRDDQNDQATELDRDSLTPMGLLSPVSPVVDRFNPELLSADNISPSAPEFDHRFSLSFARKTAEQQTARISLAEAKMPTSHYQDLNYNRESLHSSPEAANTADTTATVPSSNPVEKFNFDQLLHKTIKWSQNQSQLQSPKASSTLLLMSQPHPEKNPDVEIFVCNVQAELSDDQQITIVTSKGQIVSSQIRRISAARKNESVKSSTEKILHSPPKMTAEQLEQHWRSRRGSSPHEIFRFPDTTVTGVLERQKSDESQSFADSLQKEHYKAELIAREDVHSPESFGSVDLNERPQSPDSSSPTIRALTMPGAFLSSHRGRISNAAASRLYAGSALYDGEFGGPVDGINLEEIKEFAKQFKMKRLSLGLTQTQVGQALSLTDGPAYSQSAICRFEKLDITPKSAQKIKPVLERWMKEVDDKFRHSSTSPIQPTHSGPNSPTSNDSLSKKRKRRTSFTPQALDLLNEYFERNTHPTGAEMTALAENLNYDREVVRVWFCNKRQALKNTIKKLKQAE